MNSADFLIKHSHNDIETLAWHIEAQKKALSSLRPSGRLAQMKRDNILALKAEIERLSTSRN